MSDHELDPMAYQRDTDSMNVDSYLYDLVEDTEYRMKGVGVEGAMTKHEARNEIMAIIEGRDRIIGAKEAEIARLQALQISPEMVALYARYQAHLASLPDDMQFLYPSEQMRIESELWVEFEKTMKAAK